jgi:nucleoside 2-deoxyribosyltransferase
LETKASIKELAHADVFVALLTPTSVIDSWLLQETGAAWALEKPIVPIVTRRDVLNNFPLALDPHAMIEIDYRDRLEDPKSADKFARAFEGTLATAHVS